MAVPMKLEIVYAEKGEKRLRSIGGLNPNVNGLNDGDVEHVFSYNGDEYRDFSHLSNSGGFAKRPRGTIDDIANILFETIFIDTSDSGDGQRSAIHIPTALASDRYKLRPAMQKVDGFYCHVVESPDDVIWIDSANGFVVRRRIRFINSGKDLPPSMANLYVAKDFEEVFDGIWLPKKSFRYDFRRLRTPRSLEKTIVGRQEFSTRWRVNDIDDDLFNLTFPPGSIVINYDSGESFYAPDREEAFAEAVATGGRIPGVSIDGDFGNAMEPSGNKLSYPLIIANLILIGLIVFLLLRRKLKSA